MRKKLNNRNRQKRSAFTDIFKPENWRWQWIVGFLCLLLAINLFGPKGILHWVLIEQQSNRYANEIDHINKESSELRKKIYLISHSKVEQEVMVREKLGLLKKNEYRVDFIEAQNQEDR